MSLGKVITSVEDFTTAAIRLFETAQHEIAYIVPSSLQSLAGHADNVERAKRFIENGGAVRGIISVSSANAEEMRTRMDVGAELRHSDETHEVFMCVVDKQYSVSSINVGVTEFTLETPITAFWSEDSTYAKYLLSSFETAWSRAIPAEKRIEELLKQEAGHEGLP